ncbi:hypothetical protein TWF281_000789 [Arthrobotrys megalospora]
MATFDALGELNERFSNVSISGGAAAAAGPSNSSQKRSPVDEFFSQHANSPGSKFTYNRDAKLNIRETFDVLVKAQKWKRKKRMSEKERFFEAIDSEFTTRVGDGDKLQTWQRLVVMFGSKDPVPTSITKCKKILAEYYINIYDFLDYCRQMGIDEDSGSSGDLSSLDKGSLQNLRYYSKSKHLLYPLDLARGTVLKAFLVHMFG